MKLFDGNRMVAIEMQTWNGTGFNPDWSEDFFEAGGLPYNENIDAYTVPDVSYCIEQAEDWRTGQGDFYDPDADTDNNYVFVVELKVYVANKETGAIIEECDTIEEAKSVIRQYEADDREDGTYTEGYYDIVDADHCSIPH